MDDIFRESFARDALISYGTHVNIEFSGWEGLSEDQLISKLSTVNKLMEDWDLGSDEVTESVSLRPFKELDRVGDVSNLLAVYDIFCKHRLVFDMGSFFLNRLSQAL